MLAKHTRPKKRALKPDTHTNSYIPQSESSVIHPKILTRKSESLLIHSPRLPRLNAADEAALTQLAFLGGENLRLHNADKAVPPENAGVRKKLAAGNILQKRPIHKTFGAGNQSQRNQKKCSPDHSMEIRNLFIHVMDSIKKGAFLYLLAAVSCMLSTELLKSLPFN